MKTWPILAAHRMEEIEKVLLSFEARLNMLQPKTGGQKSIFAPSASAGLDDPYHGQPRSAPFVPIPPAGPIPAQPTPLPEPSVLPAPGSYAQSEQFAGKSIFAPPSSAVDAYHQQLGAPNPAGTLGSPSPTIFAPVAPPRP